MSFFGKIRKAARFVIKKVPQAIHLGKRICHDIGTVGRALERTYDAIPPDVKMAVGSALMAI